MYKKNFYDCEHENTRPIPGMPPNDDPKEFECLDCGVWQILDKGRQQLERERRLVREGRPEVDDVSA